MNRTSRVLPVIVALACLSSAFAQTSSDDKAWSDLRKESSRFFMQRNFDGVLANEKQALAIAEKASPSDPRIIKNLLAMATVHQLRGKSADAIPLYERAIAISDKGPEYPQIATVLNDMAAACKAVGRDSDAAKYSARAAAKKRS